MFNSDYHGLIRAEQYKDYVRESLSRPRSRVKTAFVISLLSMLCVTLIAIGTGAILLAEHTPK